VFQRKPSSAYRSLAGVRPVGRNQHSVFEFMTVLPLKDWIAVLRET
jgi:hypothetical protein